MFPRISRAILFAVLLVPGAAQAAPGIPLLLYGTASPHAEISAIADDTVIATTRAQANGTYGYAPSTFMIVDPENAREGKTLSFSVDGVRAAETTTFVSGAIVRLDFSTSTPPETPSARSRDLKSVSVTVPEELATPTTRKFALRDFNMLMADWGSREKGSAADLNDDGAVDLSDFNVLMIYWGV